jgi:RNA polymerase sigma-70 factor, ECF subfamily
MVEPPGAAPDLTAAAKREEAELVVRACGGDEEAFERLVRLAGPSALAAARRVTRDAALAEDAAQEAFLRAFRALPRYRHESSFTAWVRTIAVHAAIDLLRRRRPEAPLHDRAAGPGEEKRMEDLDLLRRALAALSPRDREILLAREMEGIPDQAIADRLHMTVTSVRVRMHRARKRLAARFREGRP